MMASGPPALSSVFSSDKGAATFPRRVAARNGTQPSTQKGTQETPPAQRVRSVNARGSTIPLPRMIAVTPAPASTTGRTPVAVQPAQVIQPPQATQPGLSRMAALAAVLNQGISEPVKVPPSFDVFKAVLSGASTAKDFQSDLSSVADLVSLEKFMRTHGDDVRKFAQNSIQETVQGLPEDMKRDIENTFMSNLTSNTAISMKDAVLRVMALAKSTIDIADLQTKMKDYRDVVHRMEDMINEQRNAIANSKMSDDSANRMIASNNVLQQELETLKNTENTVFPALIEMYRQSLVLVYGAADLGIKKIETANESLRQQASLVQQDGLRISEFLDEIRLSEAGLVS